MNEPTLYRRNFLLHLQERPGHDGPVLLKEPAGELASGSHLDQLHNEYLVTRQLAGVAGVRPALAQEGTESRPVLLLEYIRGRSLAELLRSASLDLGEKLQLALNVTRALRHVHDHQVMHKDVSSGNILVASDDPPGSVGGLYLIDFGLASSLRQEIPSRLAADDTLVGTLAYVSPEQTGRMNRQVDYRTDLYSLGICFYELFTGQLPFSGSDPLEIIHAHIARQPRPLHEVESDIPGPVSDIVLKLLAKDAEDRYQTAHGLQADVQTCLDQWHREGRIETFELGGEDFGDRLQIPQRLYGRQAEIEQLETTLDRAVEGPAQLLLVAGYSGVGKTSLVHEIQKQVIAREASFVEGKFDQLRRTLPYSAWDQALTELANSWLTGSEAVVTRWRDVILDAVGDQGQVLVDLVPALEAVIGPQPEVPQLGDLESHNRLNHVFGRFIGSLATPEHPLVVFLDDLQWIDPASLNLIESLFATVSSSSLLIIGAYRSNEVGPDHPLSVAETRLHTQSERVTIIPLGDLTSSDARQLLADTLRLPATECQDLSQLLVEKTAGNPFYFRHLLYALKEQGLLRFARPHRRWVWDDALQHSLPAGGNVVALMIQEIETLPLETQRTLSLAACLGASFEAGTLGTISGTTPSDALTALRPAMQAGLIMGSDGQLAFSHDQVQEAGYALIPEGDRARTHLEIGRLLLAHAAAEDRGEEIFDIVEHLNAGRTLIAAEPKRLELAELNLEAGQRARNASAFVDARTYIGIALDQLGPDPWQRQYELTLSLHNEYGELASYTGQYDQIAPVADLIHHNARSVLHQVRIYMTEIEAATTKYDFNAAVDIGLRILTKLEVDIPLLPTSEDYKQLRDRYFDLLTDRPMDVVAGLPEMTDERALAASEILASELAPTYISRQEIYPTIGLAGVILTLEYGHNVWSPVFFAATGNILWLAEALGTPSDEVLGHLLFSRRMHELSLELKEDQVYRRSQTRTLGQICVTGAYCFPIEFLSELSLTTFLSGFETGDLNYGGQGALHCSVYGLAAGTNLNQYRDRIEEYFRLLHQYSQGAMASYLSIFLEGAIAFQEPSAEPHKLSGDYLDEASFLPAAIAANDVTGRHFLFAVKLQLSYHFDADSELLEYIAESERFFVGAPGLFTLSVAHLYSSLARLRLYPELAPESQEEALSQVDNALRLFEIWSRSVPSTFQHMFDLITAERGRVSGDTDKALHHYEEAIQGAHGEGFAQDEALGYELYARFWAERDGEESRFCAPLMREAQSLYRKWGAHAKADHLAKRYPNWLIGLGIDVDRPRTGWTEGLAGDLDLVTVLKASQDVAGEIALGSLLAKLMTYVIQSSGAQQGCLLLERDGRWKIEAGSAAEGVAYIRGSRDLADATSLAASVVHNVAQTQETVVLGDAWQSGEFVQDPYIRQHRVRSVLCAPLVNQGRTSGILYLQNNLAPDVFSPERVGLLRLLSSQMAISIDNARSHADLEMLLESRSKALASAEVQVRTLFEESPLGIALSSPEGRILSANKAVLTMLRITEEELLQRGVVDFYDDPSDREALLRQLQDGVVQDFGVQLVRRDGSPFHANLNVNKLVLEGKEALLVMVEDVTAQIMTEQETAALEERAHLARELHDAVSQTILSASILTDSTVRSAAEGRAIATQDLTKLSQLLRGALDEMRTLILELRPGAEGKRTLGQLLGSLAEDTRARSDTKVNLLIEGDRVLPENVTMHLRRIAQEALRNITRHAEARTVNVDLICDTDGVSLRITDDGRGFDVERVPAGHHGLGIMRERAEKIGAILEVSSAIGEGTEISATWA